MAGLRRRLLAWYRKNKRDLPWRRTQDPYQIWISEIMLQKTRVAAVVPYYARFLALFPDAASLARAREQDLLAAWAGTLLASCSAVSASRQLKKRWWLQPGFSSSRSQPALTQEGIDSPITRLLDDPVKPVHAPAGLVQLSMKTEAAEEVEA